MQVYRIEWGVDSQFQDFAGSRGDAHTFAKLQEPRSSVRIELHVMVPDKPTILALLKEEEVASTVEQTWKLTARGGLEECVNGE